MAGGSAGAASGGASDLGGSGGVSGSSPGAATAGVQGQASTSGSSGLGDVAPTGGVARPPDVAGEVSQAQGGVGPERAQAEASRSIGPDGHAVLHGDASSVGEREVDRVTDEPQREAEYAARVEKVQAGNVRDEVIRDAGYRDPSSEVARAEQLEFNERDQAMAKANVVENARDDARNTVADPSGTATARVEGAASSEISNRTPDTVGEAQANVNVATATVNNPQGAAGARVDVAVDAEVRGTAAAVTPTQPGRNRPEPGGDGNGNT